MASSVKVVPGKFIVDSIHRDIHLTEREREVIDTPSFQRLRHIKQLQMSQATYPNATHTRFAHSIGTLGIMARVIEVVKQSNALKLSKTECENLQLAALLHDIGHYPYSHLMEDIDKVELTEDLVKSDKRADTSMAKYPGHVELGTVIVTNQPDLLKAIGGKRKARNVADFFSKGKAANPQLTKLITSSFDLDRLDYLLRDSYAAGVPYGHIALNYLLNRLWISPTGEIGISKGALPAVEHFLLSRFFMHRTVYYHRTTYGLEEACRQLLRRARDEGKYEVPRDGNDILKIATSPVLYHFTDSFVDDIVRQAVNDDNDTIRILAQAIQHRHPPKLLKEVAVFIERDKEYHEGATFKDNCKNRLQGLVDSRKKDVQLGQFLFCELKPLYLEKAEPRLTQQKYNVMSPEERAKLAEEEQDLVKVFLKDDEEPVSLAGIPHSIISKLTGWAFKIYRLYFVQDPQGKKPGLVDELKNAVADWHQHQ